MVAADSWGPWSGAISHAERVARLRSLRAIFVCVSPRNPIITPLRLAESGEQQDLDAARIELDRMPALDQRNILALYGKLIQHPKKRGGGP
jgi:hypothetical protein